MHRIPTSLIIYPFTGDISLELDEALFNRSEDFETRRPKQLAMPAFPTTTIGSFPQTNGALHPSTSAPALHHPRNYVTNIFITHRVTVLDSVTVL